MKEITITWADHNLNDSVFRNVETVDWWDNGWVSLHMKNGTFTRINEREIRMVQERPS